ncbi:DMT family transporter [Candidatus Dojkabacteria bacterium]|nr:DMT family transporter [Candidatus Dojkabacteria bacterium]
MKTKLTKVSKDITRSYIFLLTNAFLWGISPSIIKIGIEKINPFVYLYYRYVIVCIITLIIYIRAKSLKRLFKVFKNPKYLLTMLLTTPGPLIFQYIGIQITSSIVSSVSGALTPIIAGILGVWLLKETITKSEKTGTIVAFIGILGIIALKGGEFGNFEIQLIGAILVLLGGAVWVLGDVFFRKVKKKDQRTVSFASLFLSLVVFAVITLFVSPESLITFPTDWSVILSVVYMAIPGTLIAFIIYQMTAPHVEVSEANIFTYLQPLFGIPAAVIILGESFSPILIIPMILVALGMWLNIHEKFKHRH